MPEEYTDAGNGKKTAGFITRLKRLKKSFLKPPMVSSFLPNELAIYYFPKAGATGFDKSGRPVEVNSMLSLT